MAVLIRAFPPYKIAIPKIPRHDACGRVGARGSILFSLPLRVHDFALGGNVQGLVEGTRFDPLLSFLEVKGLKELNWAVENFLSWYYSSFRLG